MNVKIRIMVRACKIRMSQGEELENVLKSYPRLSEAEKDEIRKAVGNS